MYSDKKFDLCGLWTGFVFTASSRTSMLSAAPPTHAAALRAGRAGRPRATPTAEAAAERLRGRRRCRRAGTPPVVGGGGGGGYGGGGGDRDRPPARCSRPPARAAATTPRLPSDHQRQARPLQRLLPGAGAAPGPSHSARGRSTARRTSVTSAPLVVSQPRSPIPTSSAPATSIYATVAPRVQGCLSVSRRWSGRIRPGAAVPRRRRSRRRQAGLDLRLVRQSCPVPTRR